MLSLPGSALAAVALAWCAAAPAVAAPGFFGVVAQGEMSGADFQRLRGSGVTVRVLVGWPSTEPEPGRFDFAATDRQIGAAAARGIRVLPVLYGTPAWLSAHTARPPLGERGLRRWRGYLAALVRRYGPHGTFWRGRAVRRPVRYWQIWNEPNFRLFWWPRISPRGYARLLRASAGTIRARDRGAKIVAAGVAPIEGAIRPWEYLRRLYRVPGARRSFDIAALHPYATKLSIVEYEIRRTRRVMAQAGEGEQPLLLSEIGVSSHSTGGSPFDHGLRGQARFLNRLYARLLAKRQRWRIAGVYWYAWQDLGYRDRHCAFCEGAGLFTETGKAKPAWRAFRNVIGAVAKRSVR